MNWPALPTALNLRMLEAIRTERTQVEPITYTLNNGRVVAAKLYKGEPSPIMYANRTQAQRKADELGKPWAVAQFMGRPFYVAKFDKPGDEP